MNDENVIEERDGYRVRLELDDSPEQPYDDGAWPVLRIELGHGRAEHMSISGARPHDLDEAVENAVQHWGVSPAHPEWKLVEKWLRAYLGVTRIVTYCSDDYWYVAYDSAAWREWAGVNTERTDAESPLSEIIAWVEGEVYGWVTEKRVTWKPVSCPAEDDVTMDTWEHVEDCGGYYGYEWAEQRAREAFAALLDNESNDEPDEESTEETMYYRSHLTDAERTEIDRLFPAVDAAHTSWLYPDAVHTRYQLRELEPDSRGYSEPCPCGCGQDPLNAP